MPRWIKADLTDLTGAPGTASSPYAYLTHFDDRATARVIYRTQDSHIHELRLEPGGSWMKADLTNQAGAQNAQGRPSAYLTSFDGHNTARVVYLGQDSHIQEVRLEPGQSWKGADLTHLAGASDAAGEPYGYVTSFDSQATARVVYRGRDGHIHEIRLEAGGSWKGADLTSLTGASGSQSNPFAYITQFDGQRTARVIYLGQDSHIHEVRLEPGQSWKKSDLTNDAGAPDGEGNPMAYITQFGGSRTARVVYCGRDSHIHEVRLEPGQSWKAADLTHLAGAPDARSDPFGYVTSSGNQETARVVYLAQDSHIHELRLEAGGSWQKADLTDLARGANGDGSPFAYVTNFNNNPTPRVLYRSNNGHIEELRLE